MSSPTRRLLLRVYLSGIALLVLALGGSVVVANYLPKPPLDLPARPSTAWIAWHLSELADQPDVLMRELTDVKRRVRLEMTLFDAQGKRLASSADPPFEPLSAREVSRLSNEPTRFADGIGVVARLAPDGAVRHYVRLRYPMPESATGMALAQGAVALGLLALLAIPLARSVTAPVERLAKLAHAFGSGDLSVRAESARGDEIGDLARAFDEMAERIMALRLSEKELLANVSHELRTPLARIRLALELVRGGDASRADSYLTDIEEDLAELEQLLDDVMTTARLDLARGSLGDPLPPLRREPIAGAQVLEAARARFALRFPERKLTVSLAPDLPPLEADPALLRRVLDNLLENAVKFSDSSQPVELIGERATAPDALVVTVRDHGMGIAPNDLERVFEPFFRSDPSRTRATGGVGLGLAVVRRIVEAHGGSVSVQSSKATGTQFRVVVPVRPAKPG